MNAEPIKAAIYSRYSTDLQNERSTEDQIDLCKAFAKREGFSVVSTYADKAMSGASMHGRHDLARMLQHVKDGQFKVIVVEALDRLSRDIADMATLHKTMEFIGVRIVSVNDGEANTINVALRGLVAQLFREDGVHKVRRGMTGLIKQGLSAGGKAYGYRPDPTKTGKPVIVPDEASIVVRIFEEYAKGTSPKAICRQLNAEHVKPPRGKLWAPSALYGFASRGSGMLRNPIYVGRIVWNKNRMIKDPSTGKRLSRPNPESDWKAADVPELRIVPDELFEAVQAQLIGRAQVAKGGPIRGNNRPKRLLSGLLKCSACGSAIKAFADKLSGKAVDPLNPPRARLEAALVLLDDMGELAPIVRELIRSITIDRDDDGRLTIEVEANLVPFLHEDGQTMGAAVLVAEVRFGRTPPNVPVPFSWCEKARKRV